MAKIDRHKGIVLGITGGAGSGKSTVTAMLAALGAQTVDADALVRWVYNDDAFRRQVVARFGADVLDPAGGVDRATLAGIVFRDREALADLERLVHPAVLSQIADIIETYRADPDRAPALALEIPLLYETGAEAMVDRVVTVSASRETRYRRLEERGWNIERIAAVESSQMPSEEKETRADYVLDADGTIDETATTVEAFWRRLVG